MTGGSGFLTLHKMLYFRLFILFSFVVLLSACGGGSLDPQSERNDYGSSVAEMQIAPESISTASGTVTVQAIGNE